MQTTVCVVAIVVYIRLTIIIFIIIFKSENKGE